MKKLKKILSNQFGVDRAIFWAVFNKAFGFIKGPISIYFLVKYLTPQEQGLWYTFGSLSALTIFAELGFTSIITQFVSHEFANLNEKEGAFTGRASQVDRMMALIQFSVKFYLLIIPFAMLILIVTGFIYFKSESLTIYLAWFVFSICGGLTLFIGLLQSVYQGIDKIKEIQINLFISSLLTTLFNWLMLVLKFKIWALVAGNLMALFISSVLLYTISPNFWNQIFRYRVKGEYHFLKETLPLQWRYAISWICSYFVAYLYVPATFKLVGAVQAGQFGITMSMINVINGVANNWIFTKVPKLNMFVSSKDYNSLNNLFYRSTLQGLFVQLILSVIFILGLLAINLLYPSISQRFFGLSLTILLLMPQIVIYITGALSIYLRAFKEEPFMKLSIVNAFLIGGIIVGIMYRGFGLKTFFISLNLIYWFIMLPLSFWVFKRKKKLFLQRF